MFLYYLQWGDSVIVQSSHLFLGQSISCLVIDLEASVEFKHVKKLQKLDIRR